MSSLILKQLVSQDKHILQPETRFIKLALVFSKALLIFIMRIKPTGA